MKHAATFVIICLAASTAVAAPPRERDPNWPCQQIKVPELDPGTMWTGPPIDAEAQSRGQEQDIKDLAAKIAERRLPIEQAEAAITQFANTTGDQKTTKLTALFAELFEIMDRERQSILAGLDRFGQRQKELAANIREENQQLQALQVKPDATPQDITERTQRLNWDVKVFEDRRQALSYACNAPNKVEQRLFALARTIQQQLQ
jgi:hypothetical protein